MQYRRAMERARIEEIRRLEQLALEQAEQDAEKPIEKEKKQSVQELLRLHRIQHKQSIKKGGKR
jgi:hypothetical protein